MIDRTLHIIYNLGVLTILWLVLASFTSTMEYNRTSVNSSLVFFDMDNLSDYQKKMYERDATRLALRYVSKGSDFSNLSPRVPMEVKNEILSSLLAVHKSPFNEALEVTRKHKLHTFPNPAVDKFQVNYKNTSTWATPLKLGDNITNSETINKICDDFGLIIESHKIWDDEKNLFIVKAKQTLNMAAIAEQFKSHEGVELVNMLIPDTDGNDILATRTSKGWRLDYMIKFDSCFTGCKKKHVWSFEIANISSGSANVNFLGESGDELPDWMK